MKFLPLALIAFAFASCSTAGIERRQGSMNNAQSTILDNREARIQARDERMNASRDVWMGN